MNRFEFMDRTHVNPQTLDVWLQEEWLLPNAVSTDMEFSDIDVARAQLILDLKERLGVNDEGVSVILHLVDQVHGLRRFAATLMPPAPDATTGQSGSPFP
ncbi:chaperone modulator CbpM [Rhizobium sp.]|uniref:chaperone modulator CbpM n=1 Tax=Rhizobium sp. TaxID=391 RepID=UPI000E93D8C8|nr:hypothetical protein [Rhizobium sp.]